MAIVKRVFWRMQHERSQRITHDEIPAFADPAVASAFLRFNQYLTEKTSTRLEPLYRLRLLEIDRVIRRYRVKYIREMGSGRTTFFFNLFRDLDVISYEQDERWREVLLAFYAESGLSLPRIVFSSVENYKDGGRFASLASGPCDLLYIDGPYVRRDLGKLPTHTGKPAYYDFERILENGLPKVIMVEGRTDTVDAILASPLAREYNFKGELTWALERGRYLHALGLRRHSIFIRKSPKAELPHAV
jgi:hypothetical protein